MDHNIQDFDDISIYREVVLSPKCHEGELKAICGPKSLKAIMPPNNCENKPLEIAIKSEELHSYEKNASNKNPTQEFSMLSFKDLIAKEAAFHKNLWSSLQNFSSQPIKSCLVGKKSALSKIGKQVSFFPREKLHTIERQELDLDGSNVFKRYGFAEDNPKVQLVASNALKKDSDAMFSKCLQNYQVNF